MLQTSFDLFATYTYDEEIQKIYRKFNPFNVYKFNSLITPI